MKSDTTKAPVLRRHREMLPLPLPLPLLRLLLLLLPGPGVVRPGDCRSSDRETGRTPDPGQGSGGAGAPKQARVGSEWA